MNAAIKIKEDEFPALTGLRFLAVSMIFVHHISEKALTGFWQAVGNQLYLGVELFFVLSGFLICYKYYEAAKTEKRFFLRFFTKRFARVYPLYFLLTTFTFLYMLWKGETAHWWSLYILNISFLKGFSSHFMFTGIYPTWSLTVEETFYALAPFIFLVHKRTRALFAQVLFFYAVGALLLLVFTLFPFYGFFKHFRFITMATFFGRCFEFFAGIWLALLISRRSMTILSSSWRTYGGLAACVSIILVQAWLMPSTPKDDGWFVLRLLLSNILFPVAVTASIYGLIKERSLLRRFFSSAALQLLGKSSYAFFLIHAGVLAWWVFIYIIPGSYIGMYAGAYIISIILFFAVEQPLRNAINSLGARST